MCSYVHMLCVTVQNEKKKKTFFPAPHWLSQQHSTRVSTGVIYLGCETNESNVPDPNQESDSSAEITGGYFGPRWMDRRGTVNLENQEPKFCVFTSLLLQVMSPRCKKIQFSAAGPFVTIWENKHRISAWREMEVEDSLWLERSGNVGSCGVRCVQEVEVDFGDL